MDMYCMRLYLGVGKWEWGLEPELMQASSREAEGPSKRGKSGEMRSDIAGGNLSVEQMRKKKNESSRFAAGALAMAAAGAIVSFSLQGTASTVGLRRIRILVLADRAPHRRDEVIRGCLAVSYEACTRLAYTYAWAAEILTQPLVVFEEASELELGHGLFWA